ncbi:MAG: zinc-ribbon domain-containing protein [Alphaproteobacteria bacterium]
MTQIKCFYCQTSYEIDDTQISTKIKKLRCAKCKQIFEFHKNNSDDIIVQATTKKEEAAKESSQVTNIEEKNNNIEKPKEDNTEEETIKQDISNTAEIFARINSSLDICKNEKNDKKEKQSLKEIIGWTTNKNKIIYSIVSIIIIILLLNFFRFEITRAIPFTEIIYNSLGVKSTVNGEGLEFLNVKKENIEKDSKNYMEVKGYIRNKTQKNIKIPTIILNLLDEKGNILLLQEGVANKEALSAQERIPFNIKIENPSELSKYVYLTFVE